MNDIKRYQIGVFDDSKTDRNIIDSKITYIKKDIEKKGISIKINVLFYEDYEGFMDDIKESPIWDLIILDLYDDKKGKNVGEIILQALKYNRITIPVIIYTKGQQDNPWHTYNNLYDIYEYIYGDVISKSGEDDLVPVIQKCIGYDNYLEYEYDDADTIMNIIIKNIGIANLNDIIKRVKKDNDVIVSVTLRRMTLGYSGAFLFRLLYDNTHFIMKISKEKQKIKDEHDKALQLYQRFPDHMTININYKEYMNDNVYAYVFKEIDDSTTLYKYLNQNNNKNKIHNYLRQLFLEEKSLKNHYRNNVIDKCESYNHIFRGLSKEKKYYKVLNAINELNPILEKYEFDENAIRSFLRNKEYENILIETFGRQEFKKQLTLCHGDLHAKNILIQDDRIFIIDPGEIRYDYWCTDISRLIVNMFVNGIDYGTYDYYDINKISDNINCAESMMSLQKINYMVNDGFIISINWIIENIKNIYEEKFTLWEFELCMMKELLQTSYRVDTIPPGKRALALILASKYLKKANKSIIQ